VILILLKNPKNASTRLSMNGKSPTISTAPPFVLRFSKDERRVFQQKLILMSLERSINEALDRKSMHTLMNIAQQV